MTITFTEAEWQDFVRKLGSWRYDRDIAMEKVLDDVVGKDEKKSIYVLFNNRTLDIQPPSPIMGMKLVL